MGFTCGFRRSWVESCFPMSALAVDIAQTDWDIESDTAALAAAYVGSASLVGASLVLGGSTLVADLQKPPVVAHSELVAARIGISGVRIAVGDVRNEAETADDTEVGLGRTGFAGIDCKSRIACSLQSHGQERASVCEMGIVGHERSKIQQSASLAHFAVEIVLSGVGNRLVFAEFAELLETYS